MDLDAILPEEKEHEAYHQLISLKKYVEAGDYAEPYGVREWFDPRTHPAIRPILLYLRGLFVPPRDCLSLLSDYRLGGLFHQRILEIGPGTGRWTRELVGDREERPLVLVDGTDVAFPLLKQYSDHLYVSHDGNMPFLEDSSIDLVFSYDVFCHFEWPLAWSYCQEITRVLKPGGKAMLHWATTSMKHEHGTLEEHEWWCRWTDEQQAQFEQTIGDVEAEWLRPEAIVKVLVH